MIFPMDVISLEISLFYSDGGYVLAFDIEPQLKPIYAVKVFIFDNLSTLEPLAEMREIVRVDVN